MIKLQLFADENPQATPGKKIVYLYRVYSATATEAATALAFTTENGRTKSADAYSTTTKDGTIRTPGSVEQEITATSVLKIGDTLVDTLENALDNGYLMEIWEADLAEPGSGSNKYKGRYFQGYITELERSSNAEDHVEISLTFGINGSGATGEVTVTDDQQKIAEYTFKDSTATM